MVGKSVLWWALRQESFAKTAGLEQNIYRKGKKIDGALFIFRFSVLPLQFTSEFIMNDFTLLVNYV